MIFFLISNCVNENPIFTKSLRDPDKGFQSPHVNRVVNVLSFQKNDRFVMKTTTKN